MTCSEVFCPECDSCICKECCDGNCDCDCQAKVIEVKDITLSYTIKTVFHEWQGKPLTIDDRDDIYDCVEDAVQEYDFGNPRPGAHHWDQDACHVSQCPVTKKFILLYM